MLGWLDDIERATLDNSTFRTVLFTGPHAQLTVMSLQPGEEIGREVHEDRDQFLRLEQGKARVEFGRSGDAVDETHEVEADWAVIVPAGVWHNLPYSVSKGGVITLTTHMAVHHGREGIRVNCIAPGMIYSAMVSDRVGPELRARRREAAVLGTEGTAWDIAWAALFLASDEARWITGVTLPVDGGLMAAAPTSMLPHEHKDT